MKKLSLILAVVMALICVFTGCGEEGSGGLSITADGSAATTQIVSGLTGEMDWEANGEVSKTPKAVVIQNGAYVGLD